MKRAIFSVFKNIAKAAIGTKIGSIPFIMNLYKLSLTLLSPKSVKVGKLTFFLDKEDSLSLSVLGEKLNILPRLIIPHVKKSLLVIDVGAHIGTFSIPLSHYLGRQGKIYAFEPNTKNFQLLKKNLLTNQIENVTAVNKAVSNISGRTKFSISDNSQTGKLTTSKKPTQSKYITVESIRLDDFFSQKQIQKISLIKIDVEGAEYKVIEGMRKILQVSKTKLLIEYCPQHLKDYAIAPEQILNLLERYGFEFYDIGKDRDQLLKRTKRDLQEKHYLDGITDLFCIKRDI